MKVENEMITFEDQDEFERRGFAERMIRLLNSDIDVSPLVIEGDWGVRRRQEVVQIRRQKVRV